jgi:glyoxylase-like metal-dependent hydrolase (beta-lactamase superfamily II)
MLIRSFPAPMFGTNCWVIASGKGSECIIVDPGMPDISAEIELIVSEEGLKPVAALMTHGHLDHTFSITALADGYGIPAYIHSEDRRFIADPAGIHDAQFRQTISAMSFAEPQDTRTLRDGELLNLVGISIKAIHAPGHTRGSLMFLLNDEYLLSGDVLFSGTIGRTDQPTGSAADMKETLRKKILPLDDAIEVLPGHGPQTTIENERKRNPYLKELR